MVEFAVVAPLFFLIVFTAIEAGRMVMVHQILANATREGARRAILEQTTAAEAEAIVADYLAGASISGATVTVSPASFDQLGRSDPITVSAEVPFAGVCWLPVPRFFGETTISQQTTMRAERPK